MNILSSKEYTSLQFNAIEWKVSLLGEKVFLLEAAEETQIEFIHDSVRLIEEILTGVLDDIVPAYHSIALFTSLEKEDVLGRLEASSSTGFSRRKLEHQQVEIPICYELGLDLKVLAAHNNLSETQVIECHLGGTYRSLFIGFTPGFIYADGLDKRLACPRRASPRTLVSAGSVGIGGAQTGIYSIASPGGWNIIGRTPLRLFDALKTPPMLVNVGTSFTFRRITKEEFEKWES